MAMLVITRGYVAKGCGDESGATEPNSEVPGTDDYIQKKRFFDWLWTFNVGRATCTWICFTGPCNKLGGAKGVKSNFKWSWLAMVKSNQDSPSSKSTKSQRIRRCPWGINKNTAGGRWPWKNRHVPWILGSQNFGLLPALWDNFLILFDCKLKTYIYLYIQTWREWAPMGTWSLPVWVYSCQPLSAFLFRYTEASKEPHEWMCAPKERFLRMRRPVGLSRHAASET